jgi:hypothetical protein
MMNSGDSIGTDEAVMVNEVVAFIPSLSPSTMILLA